MHREDGGVVTKLLAWLLMLAVAASVGFYVYVRSLSPLDLTTITAGVQGVRGGIDDVPLRTGGRIVVAAMIENDGRFPVTIAGLGMDAARRGDPYVATELRLGDGKGISLEEAAPFTPTQLEPGVGVGVVVVFTPNRRLRCTRLPREIGAEIVRTPLSSFALTFTIAGIGGSQILETAEPFAVIGPVTRSECESVTRP